MEREQQRLKAKTLLLSCALSKSYYTDVQNMHAWSDYEWSKVQTPVIKLCYVHSIHS